MRKRNGSIIIGVIVLIVGICFAKGILKSNKELEQNSKTNAASMSLKEKYEKLNISSKPSIIIFSYDAECCENTKKFFNEYNSKAKQLMADYERKFTILFINTGILKGVDKDTLMKIAKENGISQLPAISIRDTKGKAIKTIEGTFHDKEVRKLLDEVKN